VLVIASKAPRLNNPRTVSTVASATGMSEQEVRSTLGDEQGLAWYAGPCPFPIAALAQRAESLQRNQSRGHTFTLSTQ
jgi:hypothetical protein